MRIQLHHGCRRNDQDMHISTQLAITSKISHTILIEEM